MTPQEKAQLDYAVKRYKAAENHIETLYLALSAQETPIDTFTPWQSLVNSEPTISKMETVEDGKDWPGDVEIFKWFRSQKYQREQGDQEYMMIYEIDLPKIIRSFMMWYESQLTQK